MGMLIEGIWRESGMTTNAASLSQLPKWTEFCTNNNWQDSRRYILVASESCPWSHAVLIARAVLDLKDTVPLHFAGGPRIEGYALHKTGPINEAGVRHGRPRERYQHVHQLYHATDAAFTGRVTVPVLWDSTAHKLVLADSADILVWLDCLSDHKGGYLLRPDAAPPELEETLELITDGLVRPAYRAGSATTQHVYDEAVDLVFSTLDTFEELLGKRRFLLGSWLSICDVRLFCALVRFDIAYGPLFRCTRRRLVDYKHLWAYARDITAWPGVAQTVNIPAILDGYYSNDGNTNPHRIIAEAPEIDWSPSTARKRFAPACLWSSKEGQPQPCDPAPPSKRSA